MKTSTLNLLAAGLVSAGVLALSSGCTSSSCSKGSCCQADVPSCAEKGPYGHWALTLPYDTMNAGHLILARDANGKPSATLLWRWASPTPADVIALDDKRFTIQRPFSIPKGKNADKTAWRALRVSGVISGKTAACTCVTVNGLGQNVDAPAAFTAVKNPPIGPAPDLAQVKYGAPVNLLAGSMADFELMGGANKVNGWSLKDGVLSNRVQRDAKGKPTHKNGNLRTKRADFFDFNLSYEVRVLPGCNSGVYLRGIYEIQVMDSYGKPVDCHNMAAFYGRITPSVAAEKKAGEWQRVDVTLVDRHVTVILNGVKIIDNKPVEGPTGGAMTANEFIPGPIYLQGDHTDADFRNMVLKPIIK